ncbi:sugar ABC transporter permease, partial [Acidobacteria bacterium ACD]|nr:sugar ABC transporter permease [Acidobacteria bacterium ACD]
LEALKVAGIALALSAFFAVLAANQGMPVAVLLLALVVVALDFVARHTVFGRHLYAAGAGPEAARLSGIDVKKRVFQLFALFGALTGLSGIVLTARLNAATTSAGVNMELDAIAAAVIGGTSLMGGEGTVTGAVVGALIMASLDNGMSLLNLDVTFQYVVKGLVLLLAVWVDMATRKRG